MWWYNPWRTVRETGKAHPTCQPFSFFSYHALFSSLSIITDAPTQSEQGPQGFEQQDTVCKFIHTCAVWIMFACEVNLQSELEATFSPFSHRALWCIHSLVSGCMFNNGKCKVQDEHYIMIIVARIIVIHDIISIISFFFYLTINVWEIL